MLATRGPAPSTVLDQLIGKTQPTDGPIEFAVEMILRNDLIMEKLPEEEMGAILFGTAGFFHRVLQPR